MRKIARRSIVAAKDVESGEKISYDNIEYKRPGTGLYPKFTDFVIGKKIKQEIKKGELITLEKIK